jgi:hypothetical protein
VLYQPGDSFDGNVLLTKANLLALGLTTGTLVDPSITFNSDFAFDFDNSNGVTSNRFDFESVAAHEIGHALQFDHVTNASKDDETNVMWPYFAKGDTSGRKLGRGDALEDNSHY